MSPTGKRSTEKRESGDDLDWGGRWLVPFAKPLHQAQVRTVLELGCGTGNDAARLARDGYEVTAVDFSAEAIDEARSKFGSSVRFVVADVRSPLPWLDKSLDAVMANVALHMFSDADTRKVFAEVGRVVRDGGLLLLHVNALEDRPLRARWRPARELEADYVLEEGGQTMHFFSKAYLEDLLCGWHDVRLDLVEVTDPATSESFKWVWCVVATR